MVWAMAVLGLVILILAGDFLVKGAVNLALRLGIPTMVVSLTIVAFGTSAPELLVSIQAAIEGVPGIALGNVVGSNIANVLLVLGIPAMISGIQTSTCNTQKTYVIMVASSVLFMVLAYTGKFGFAQSLILLFGLMLFMFDAYRQTKKPNQAEEDPEGADASMPLWKVIGFLVVGLVGLPLGAGILVDSSTEIARMFGVSETVIGLTLVAVGTSMPELATSVMAAIRNQADVAMGNVIGSNIFNLLGIIGIAGLVHPIAVEPRFVQFDLWVMLGVCGLIIPFVFLKWNLTRFWGFLLTALYGVYVISMIG